MAAPLRTINATIAKVNGHGFQIAEQPGVWLNLSKFASPPPVVPPVGTECELGLDSSGFVREITALAFPGPPAAGARSHVVTEPAQGETSTTMSGVSGAVCYERSNLYAACLQAAAMHGATRGDFTESAVAELADVWFRRAVSVGTRKQ